MRAPIPASLSELRSTAIADMVSRESRKEVIAAQTFPPLPVGEVPAKRVEGGVKAAREPSSEPSSEPSREFSIRPPLTHRQRQCLVLVAQGKSDRQIGQLLGISDETAHKHVEAAKKRFAVVTRIELVVLALMDRQIAFADVVG